MTSQKKSFVLFLCYSIILSGGGMGCLQDDGYRIKANGFVSLPENRPLYNQDEVDRALVEVGRLTQNWLQCKKIEGTCEKLGYGEDFTDEERKRHWVHNLILARHNFKEESREIQQGVYLDKLNGDIDRLLKELGPTLHEQVHKPLFARVIGSDNPFKKQLEYLKSWNYVVYLSRLDQSVVAKENEKFILLLRTLNPDFTDNSDEVNELILYQLRSAGFLRDWEAIRTGDGTEKEAFKEQVKGFFEGTFELFEQGTDELIARAIPAYDVNDKGDPNYDRTEQVVRILEKAGEELPQGVAEVRENIPKIDEEFIEGGTSDEDIEDLKLWLDMVIELPDNPDNFYGKSAEAFVTAFSKLSLENVTNDQESFENVLKSRLYVHFEDIKFTFPELGQKSTQIFRRFLQGFFKIHGFQFTRSLFVVSGMSLLGLTNYKNISGVEIVGIGLGIGLILESVSELTKWTLQNEVITSYLSNLSEKLDSALSKLADKAKVFYDNLSQVWKNFSTKGRPMLQKLWKAGGSVVRHIAKVAKIANTLTLVATIYFTFHLAENWDLSSPLDKAAGVITTTVTAGMFAFNYLKLAGIISVSSANVVMLVAMAIIVIISIVALALSHKPDIRPGDGDPKVVYYSKEIHPSISYWSWPEGKSGNRIQRRSVYGYSTKNRYYDHLLLGRPVGGHGGDQAFHPGGTRTGAAALDNEVLYHRIKEIKVWRCKRNGKKKDIGFSYKLSKFDRTWDPSIFSANEEKTYKVGCDKNRQDEETMTIGDAEYLSQLWVTHKIESRSRRIVNLRFITNMSNQIQVGTLSNTQSCDLGLADAEADGLENTDIFENCLEKMNLEDDKENKKNEQIVIFNGKAEFTYDGGYHNVKGEIVGFHGTQGKTIDSIGPLVRVTLRGVAKQYLFAQSNWFHEKTLGGYCRQTIFDKEKVDHFMNMGIDFLQGKEEGRCECQEYLFGDQWDNGGIMTAAGFCFEG